jgi:hypothetical protein
MCRVERGKERSMETGTCWTRAPPDLPILAASTSMAALPCKKETGGEGEREGQSQGRREGDGERRERGEIRE